MRVLLAAGAFYKLWDGLRAELEAYMAKGIKGAANVEVRALCPWG